MLERLIGIAKMAGETIMRHYGSLVYTNKDDYSPVTIADLESSSFICKALESEFGLPVLSEERLVTYNERKSWKEYWLVDPLDGTKDFLDENGEFTVNISLIRNRRPQIGVIFAPALNECWWASKGMGAYKDGIKLKNKSKRKHLIGLDSRHHQSKDTQLFFKVNNIRNVNYIGSSLKMCKVAEGKADIYPRLNGTKEWDTAASEVILDEAGCSMVTYPDREPLVYNKHELKNPYFVAFRDGLKWK